MKRNPWRRSSSSDPFEERIADSAILSQKKSDLRSIAVSSAVIAACVGATGLPESAGWWIAFGVWVAVVFGASFAVQRKARRDAAELEEGHPAQNPGGGA